MLQLLAVRDSLGNEVTKVQQMRDTPVVLRVGDEVTFECAYWDPEGRPCETKWWMQSRPSKQVFDRQFIWTVSEIDIGERHHIWISLESDRPYHRTRVGDDVATFVYMVLPRY